jgi:hypothetical protein
MKGIENYIKSAIQMSRLQPKPRLFDPLPFPAYNQGAIDEYVFGLCDIITKCNLL